METREAARRFGTAAVVVALLLLLMALVTGRLAHSKGLDGPTVAAAQIRLPAVPGRPAAGYFTVEGGARDDMLVAVDVAAPMRVEMHESMMMHGSATMMPLKRVDVPAGGRLSFAPGGKHLMIYGVPKALRPGVKVPLTLRFAHAGPVPAEAVVRSAGDDMASPAN